MKPDAKEIGNNFRKLRASLKPVEHNTRVHLCWSMLEEYMEEKEENVDLVGRKWKIFLYREIKRIRAKRHNRGRRKPKKWNKG